jgi:hypothetical protein
MLGAQGGLSEAIRTVLLALQRGGDAPSDAIDAQFTRSHARIRVKAYSRGLNPLLPGSSS